MKKTPITEGHIRGAVKGENKPPSNHNLKPIKPPPAPTKPAGTKKPT